MYTKDIKLILADSLRELLKTKSIQSISVKQITDNCGLSTRSFYNYFADKYDLANFIYYTVNEVAWFQDGLPCNLTQGYTSFITSEQISFPVWRNMFKYTGQNNVRDFALHKTKSDLCRLFLWNNCGDMLQERQTREIIAFFSHGLTNMLTNLICHSDPLCVISPETLLACLPEDQRKVLTADPTQSPLLRKIKVYDPDKPTWPPKLYTCSDTKL